MTVALRIDRQRGVILIAALFLIIVLAGLGIFAMRVGGAQQQSVNLALLGVRAQAAADSGIEYAANRALRASGCPFVAPGPTITTLPVTLIETALNGFSASVTCSHTQHVVGVGLGAVTYDVYKLDASAQSGTYGTPAYVARTATRTVTVHVP